MPSTVGSMPRLTPEWISCRVPPSEPGDRLVAGARRTGPSTPFPGRPSRSCCRARWPTPRRLRTGGPTPRRAGLAGSESRAGCATRFRSFRSSSTDRTRWRTHPSPSAPSLSRTRIRMWSRWFLVWLEVVKAADQRQLHQKQLDRCRAWVMGDRSSTYRGRAASFAGEADGDDSHRRRPPKAPAHRALPVLRGVGSATGLSRGEVGRDLDVRERRVDRRSPHASGRH